MLCPIPVWPFLYRQTVLHFASDCSIFETFRCVPLCEQLSSFFLIASCPPYLSRPNSWWWPESTMWFLASEPLHNCFLSLNILRTPLHLSKSYSDALAPQGYTLGHQWILLMIHVAPSLRCLYLWVYPSKWDTNSTKRSLPDGCFLLILRLNFVLKKHGVSLWRVLCAKPELCLVVIDV